MPTAVGSSSSDHSQWLFRTRRMWNAAGTQVVNETVAYNYDSIGRLGSSSGSSAISGQTWAQTYSYDGFGNLYNTFGTGIASPFNLNSQASLNSEKNQMGAHDANGNPTGLTFDVDNRLKAQQVYTFGYAADNKRVARSKEIGGGEWEHEVAFYSGGSRLGRYRVTASAGTWLVETIHEERYFAGKQIMPQDRLGSAAQAWLLPYGGELTTGLKPSEPNDRVKFATYTRDQWGYDYADQRYYGNARSLTPDPYVAGGGVGDPSSWNVEGDPVNFLDTKGLQTEVPPPGSCEANPLNCLPRKTDPSGPTDEPIDGMCLVSPENVPAWCPNYDSAAAQKIVSVRGLAKSGANYTGEITPGADHGRARSRLREIS